MLGDPEVGTLLIKSLKAVSFYFLFLLVIPAKAGVQNSELV